MTPAVRTAVIAAVLAFAAFAGWRILGLLEAERFATADPERALGWNADAPDALWALAEHRLERGDRPGAAAAARTLLARDPLQGRAFRLLAGLEAEAGRPAEARRLYLIAVHRAPRDAPAISGLVQLDLQREDYPSALRWIDFYLRTSPDRTAASGRVLRQLVPMALDGRFATALVAVLRGDPPWRADMLRALRANPTAASRVFEGLDREHALRPQEFGDWIDGLIAAGDWDEAYARWAGRAPGADRTHPGVYNGDFILEPSGSGFDWRLPTDSGVSSTFEPVAGSRRRALGLRFRDLPVRGVLLEQPLHLAPGGYSLRLRQRARALRSAIAPVWQVVCAGTAGAVAVGDPVIGSFEWTESELAFRIPPQACPGQWLRLATPAQGGKGARTSGELWIDAVRIEPNPAAREAAVAPPLRPAHPPVKPRPQRRSAFIAH